MASASVFPGTMSFAFGIEMELLVQPKPALHERLRAHGWDKTVTFHTGPSDDGRLVKNREALRKALAAALTDERIPADANGAADSNYEKWTVADERSLDERPGYWRLELVSKVLESSNQWQQEIDFVFQVLHRNCLIQLTNGCSMHVHVSPALTGGPVYMADDLRSLVKAIAYYDDPITKVMPGMRKNTPWAMSNVQSHVVPSNIQEAYRAVPRATWQPLFNIFDKVKFKPMFYRALGQKREMSWNFAHVMDTCGTVEFRRPPGVSTSTEAKHWAAFALNFVCAAMTAGVSEHQASKTYPDIESLKHFLLKGAVTMGPTCHGALLHIKESFDSANVYSSAELKTIEEKKALKRQKQSVFVEKANSRPNTPVS